MEEEVRDAVFGNVGTTVVFRVTFDAEVLETIFMPKFTKEDVVGLDKRQVYLTLMIDGVGSAPFSAVTIPPIEAPRVSHREQVIASSRAQFAAVRASVEKLIVDELAASTVSEAPFDARMKKKPTRPPVQREQIKSFIPRIAPRQETREVIHRPPPRLPMDRPLPPTKSAEDLKAILRTMTAKSGKEKEKKQEQNQQSLKGSARHCFTE